MSNYLRGSLTGVTMMLAPTFAQALGTDEMDSIAALPPAIQILPVPSIPAPAPMCRVRIVEYFSHDNLIRINNELGEIKNWIKDHNYLDPSLSAYFHEDAYSNLMSYEISYQPGTEMGEIYLQDPMLALGAMFAYTDFAEELKYVMYETGRHGDLFNFSSRFDSTLERLRGIALTTEDLMEKQIADSCLPPAP